MGAEVGEGVSINGHSWFYGRGKIRISDGTWLGVGCKFYSVAGHVINIGKNCDIAPEVIFVPGTHKIGTSERRAGEGYSLDIHVGDGCWIGTRATILGGVTIGCGVIVAAGSVVRSDLPSNCIAAGVPAVPKKILEK
jgi:maltose O-acetyltransferase